MILGREPAVLLGLVGSLIALGVGFGLDVTPEQVGLIMAAVSAILGAITRTRVTPTSTTKNEDATIG